MVEGVEEKSSKKGYTPHHHHPHQNKHQVPHHERHKTESDSEPEFTLNKLNTLIKSQLRLFLLPQPQAKDPVPSDLVGGNVTLNEKRHRRKRRGVDWHKVLEVVLCDLFLFCLIPIAVPLLLLNFLIRALLNLYLSVSSKGKIKLMRGEDAFYAKEAPYNPGNFTSLYIIEGVPDLDKIRKRFGASWVERKDKLGRPMFTKLKLKAVQKAHFFAWEFDTTFDLKKHIRYLHPNQTQRPIGESQLFEEITKIYDQLLPDDKPQWEVLLVPNYVYDDETLRQKRHYALIFRVHHSIMDGLSAAQALRLMVADNVVEAGVDPMTPMKGPWWQKVVLYIFAILLSGPYILRHKYVQEETNAFHGPSLTGPKSLGWSRPIRLSAIKKLKESTHSSVTAVFIAAIGGAFKSLAEGKGLPLPEKLTGATCAAFIPYPNIKAQNRFCVLFTPIDAKIHDSQERVWKAQIPFDKKFEGAAEVVMAYWITWLGGSFPIKVLNWLQEGICQGTVLISNLPGPKSTAQIFGGDPIVDIVGWSPIKNRIGIAMCLFGYNGRVRANVLADSCVFPDPSDVANFISAFEKEIKDLGKNFGLREEDCFTTPVMSRNRNLSSTPANLSNNNFAFKNRINKYIE